ncbi:MAG: hypothetical protein FGF48_03385 [Candidatus Brockarchaeota archaeon]|nr:hypothetical protein [Candidatus Brockarchaeota archaeon]
MDLFDTVAVAPCLYHPEPVATPLSLKTSTLYLAVTVKVALAFEPL